MRCARLLELAFLAGALVAAGTLQAAEQEEPLPPGAVETLDATAEKNGVKYFGPFVSIENCRRARDARIVILEKPIHGDAAIVSLRSDTSCDRPVLCAALRYNPAKGYAGEDRLAFRVEYSDGEVRTRQTIIHVE